MDTDDNDNRSLNDDDDYSKLIELDEIENHLIKFIQSFPTNKYDEIKAKYLNSNNENSLSIPTNMSMVIFHFYPFYFFHFYYSIRYEQHQISNWIKLLMIMIIIIIK